MNKIQKAIHNTRCLIADECDKLEDKDELTSKEAEYLTRLNFACSALDQIDV